MIARHASGMNRLLFWMLPLVLAACTVGPDFVRPVTATGPRYGAGALPEPVLAGGVVQRLRDGGEVPANWWHLFRSAGLNAQVDAALVANPTLQAAEASLRQSQDRLRAGYGVFYPHVALAAGVTRERAASAEQGTASSGTLFNLFTLTGSIGYALDVFGGAHRSVELLQAQTSGQSALVHAAYVTLTAALVNTVIARGAYLDERDTVRTLIRLQQAQLAATESAERSGFGSHAAVLTIRSLLDANQALLPALALKITAAGDLLATLGGKLPAEQTAADIRLAELSLPLDVPLSLPSALVQQRPDILVAQADLHAASAAIGVATAALFPAITLDASYGAAANRFGALSSGAARFWSIGPGVTAPVFQGGALWYGREAARDAYQQSLAQYRQTVLTAFAQVADTLAALDSDGRVLQAQDAAVADADAALGLLQVSVQAGTLSAGDALAGDVLRQQARVLRLQTVALRFQDTVALLVALGGGWWNPSPTPTLTPTPTPDPTEHPRP